MVQVKNTLVWAAYNPNGTKSIYKGARLDMVAENEREFNNRLKVLFALGYKIESPTLVWSQLAVKNP